MQQKAEEVGYNLDGWIGDFGNVFAGLWSVAHQVRIYPYFDHKRASCSNFWLDFEHTRNEHN